MTQHVALRSTTRTRRRGIAALVSATIVVGALAPVAAHAAGGTAPLADSAPSWLSQARLLGPAAPSTDTTVRVYLAPRGGVADLQRAATAVSTPGTSSYRHFLTVAQYRSQFAPSVATVRRVESWLRSSGLAVDAVAPGNRYVAVHGSVASAEKAFGVSLQRYRRDDQDVVAPSATVRVPSTVAASVLSVTGLDTSQSRRRPQLQPASMAAGFVNGRPCSLYYGEFAARYQADFRTKLPKFDGRVLPYAPCGYTGTQLRGAYEGTAASSEGGTGVGVAVVGPYASAAMASDVQTYAASNGDGAYRPGQFGEVLPNQYTHRALCADDLWTPTDTASVEAVHAMAPAARIRYFASSSCFDPDLVDALARAVDQNRVALIDDVATNAFESDFTDSGVIAAYESVFLEGTLQGISFVVGSGDYSDQSATTGIKGVDYPASDPYVTGVGGTATGIGYADGLSFQTAWGSEKYSLSSDGSSWTPEGFLYGSGGGQSALFNQPDYQAGATPVGSRAVPDVAMDADPTTGMLVGVTQQFPDGNHYGEYRLGGTELAGALFAGMSALTVQNSGRRLGLLNPLIYQDRSTAFRDVTKSPHYLGAVRSDYVNGLDPTDGIEYSVRTFDQDGSLNTRAGYDYTTGLGSPTTTWTTAGGTG